MNPPYCRQCRPLYATYGNRLNLNLSSMTTKVLLTFLLVIFISSCSNHRSLKNVDTPFKFTTYEVSFTNGWSDRFSFSVDTSKVFLAAYRFDTLRYGILPDSIFEIINKNAFTLLNDKSITNTNQECYDCSSISVLVSQDSIFLPNMPSTCLNIFLLNAS